MKEDVKLKNGGVGSQQLISATMEALKTLGRPPQEGDDPVAAIARAMALFELYQLCKDPGHQLFGNAGQVLYEAGLVDRDGKVHDAVRDIVLSAVIEEDGGMDVSLGSPYAEGGGQ